jgi:flagellar basal body-associated protein FliL
VEPVEGYGVIVALVVVLALGMLAYFAFMWTKDKGRSDETGDDAARTDTDSSGTRSPRQD